MPETLPDSKNPPDNASPLPDLSGKRVAVTGATGFLGGHVLQQLERTHATIIAVVDPRRTGRHKPLDPAIEISPFELPHELVPAVRAASPDYVIHLHAVLSTERTAAAVRTTVETNLLPSIDMMAACTEMQVKRLILIGSGEEFGPVSGPFDDRTMANPPSPYGASKAAITGYARMFHRAFQLPVAVLRPSVIYGPYQAPRMLIPQVMQALLEGREVPTTEGRQTRDFIHVGDVAQGIVRALTVEEIDGRSWNLGSGEIVTVRECLARIARLTGREDLIRYGALPYRVGEMFTYEPFVDDTCQALHWRPAISLDEGLQQTWTLLRNTYAATSSQ